MTTEKDTQVKTMVKADELRQLRQELWEERANLLEQQINGVGRGTPGALVKHRADWIQGIIAKLDQILGVA